MWLTRCDFVRQLIHPHKFREAMWRTNNKLKRRGVLRGCMGRNILPSSSGFTAIPRCNPATWMHRVTIRGITTTYLIRTLCSNYNPRCGFVPTQSRGRTSVEAIRRGRQFARTAGRIRYPLPKNAARYVVWVGLLQGWIIEVWSIIQHLDTYR